MTALKTDNDNSESSSIVGVASTISNSFKKFSLNTLFGDFENGTSTSKITTGDFNQPVTFYIQDASEWWRISDYKAGINININDSSANYSIGFCGSYFSSSYNNYYLETLLGVDKVGHTFSKDFDYKNYSAGEYTHVYLRPWTVVPAAAFVYYSGGAAACLFPLLQYGQ